MIWDLSMLLVSLVPGIEARGASIYFFCSNQLMLIPFAVALNFAGVMFFLKLLDAGKVPGRVESLIEKRAGKFAERIERWFERYGNITLFLLIALPSTGIGSYTGAFIGRVFGLEGAKFYTYILLGIISSLALAFTIAFAINHAFLIPC